MMRRQDRLPLWDDRDPYLHCTLLTPAIRNRYTTTYRAGLISDYKHPKRSYLLSDQDMHAEESESVNLGG
jgi:hypothetical protein